MAFPLRVRALLHHVRCTLADYVGLSIEFKHLITPSQLRAPMLWWRSQPSVDSISSFVRIREQQQRRQVRPSDLAVAWLHAAIPDDERAGAFFPQSSKSLVLSLSWQIIASFSNRTLQTQFKPTENESSTI
jgi:hypothetical protein